MQTQSSPAPRPKDSMASVAPALGRALTASAAVGGLSYALIWELGPVRGLSLQLGLSLVASVVLARIAPSGHPRSRDIALGATMGALLAVAYTISAPALTEILTKAGVPTSTVTLGTVLVIGFLTGLMARASGAREPIGGVETWGVQYITRLALPLAVLTTLLTAFSDAANASSIVGNITAGFVSIGVALGAGFGAGHWVGSKMAGIRRA